MRKSESIAKLAEALAIAQKAMTSVKKESDNPFFKSKYADLSSIWEACKDHLNNNGLSVIQTTRIPEDDGIIVETILLHKSGEWMMGELKMIPVKAGPQAVGSVITYARRYALAAMVGVCPEDDDGEGGEERDKKKKPEASKKKKETTNDTGWFAFLKAMGEQKKRLGEDVYYMTLMFSNYKKATDLKGKDKGEWEKIYRALEAVEVQDG